MAEESTTATADNATQQEPPPTAAAAAVAESTEQPTKQPPPAASASASASAAETKNATSTANIEFEPPAACIRRLLKQALPKSTNVSKDSLAAISRASGIFVLYLTACANDVAREGRRTTIVAKDVLGALKELEFGEFVPLMEKFLEGHRKEEKNKKDEKERLKKQQLELKEKEGRDGSTGKFVPKEDGTKLGDDENDETKDDGKQAASDKKGEDGTDTATKSAAEKSDEATASTTASAAAGETKHARESDNEGEKEEEPLAKKQKVDEENEDKEE